MEQPFLPFPGAPGLKPKNDVSAHLVKPGEIAEFMQVMADFQPVGDLLFAGLADALRPPAPEAGGGAVGRRAFGVAGVAGQGGGGPAVDQETLGLVVAVAHRRQQRQVQEPPPGRGEAGRGGYRRPVFVVPVTGCLCHFGRGQHIVQVRGRVVLSGRLQSRLGCLQAGGAGRVGGVRGGGGDLPDQAGFVHRFPVDRGAQQQAAGQRQVREALQQLVEQDVGGGQGHGCGQRGVEIAGPVGAPRRGVGQAGLARQMGEQPLGHVVETGGAAAQQGVGELQRPGMAADALPDPEQVGGRQGLQPVQPRHQLAGLGPGQGAEMDAPEPPRRLARKGERIPAGEQQPASLRRRQPQAQQFRQIGLLRRQGVVAEVILEIVEQHHQRSLYQHGLGQRLEPPAPFQLDLAQQRRDPAEIPAVFRLGAKTGRLQPVGDHPQQPVGVGFAGHRDHQDAVAVGQLVQNPGGERAFADAAEAVDQHAAAFAVAQGPADQPLFPAAADHVVDPAHHHPGVEPGLVGLAQGLEAAGRVIEPERGGGGEQGRGRPFRRRPVFGRLLPARRFHHPAGVVEGGQRLRLGGGGQGVIDLRHQVGGVAVADAVLHGDHRRHPGRHQGPGETGQAAGLGRPGIGVTAAPGGAAGQHHQRRRRPGGNRLPPERFARNPVFGAVGGLQDQGTGERVAGQVQDVIAPLAQRLMDVRDAAIFQDADPGPALLPGRVGGVEDAPQFGFHVQQVVAGVLDLRAADGHQDAQRTGHRQRRRRPAGGGPPEQRNPRVQRQRPEPGQAQGLPGQLGQRFGQFQGQFQGTAQPHRLLDGGGQRRGHRRRQESGGQGQAHLVQQRVLPGVGCGHAAGLPGRAQPGALAGEAPGQFGQRRHRPGRRRHDGAAAGLGKAGAFGGDGQLAGPGAGGQETAARRQRRRAGAGRRPPPFALEHPGQFGHARQIVGTVGAAEVDPDPGGQKRRQFGIPEQHRDQRHVVLDGPGDQHRVFRPDPAPGQRRGRNHQDAGAAVAQAGFESLDQNVARPNLPFVEKDPESRLVQIFRQHPDPVAVIVAIGDEDIPGARVVGHVPASCFETVTRSRPKGWHPVNVAFRP